MVDVYDDPVQMEPLVIDDSRPVFKDLHGLAHELSEVSACLDAAVIPSTAKSLSELVEGLNCYYSNLIEGHITLPIDIDQALHEVTEKADRKNLQSLALAHIEADRWGKQQSLGKETLKSFLLNVHRTFCQHLPAELLQLDDGAIMTPGEFRTWEVQVGRHLAPKAETLGSFMDRYQQVYGQRLDWAKKGGLPKLTSMVSTFAAHHRLAWIHPFLDGNGRVARSTLDAMLRACGVSGASLWSMSRGLAKTSDQYKAYLAGADEARHGALDGRGNLTEKGLAEFFRYGMQTAIDQANYMASMFSLENFQARASGYFRKVRYTDMKPEAAHLYLHAFVMGEFERGEASRITGLAERTARSVLSDLIGEGFLVSDSPKGKVRVGFPIHALGSLLPNLYPAGDVDITPEQLAEIRHRKKIATSRPASFRQHIDNKTES
ncbi:Fic family protein [Pseudogulbenkiania sp. MAI-1]|uniref:Fic family protein n=1 Tax=Pseudogulbenkiania sp. MAI-1 TaxID=990370 RepID=UPI00045E7997|nr:Fic family protein [Pseudogulbenkiania sp. MAI-1]